jgi:DNA-binding response OmpR family regulator
LPGEHFNTWVRPLQAVESSGTLKLLAPNRFAVDWVTDGRAAPIATHGSITLDSATREVRVHGEAVGLSPREFALLEALLARPGAVLSRAQLEEKLYGWNEPVESNAVEVHLHTLRKKLGGSAIRNIRGVGWTLGSTEPDA